MTPPDTSSRSPSDLPIRHDGHLGPNTNALDGLTFQDRRLSETTLARTRDRLISHTTPRNGLSEEDEVASSMVIRAVLKIARQLTLLGTKKKLIGLDKMRELDSHMPKSDETQSDPLMTKLASLWRLKGNRFLDHYQRVLEQGNTPTSLNNTCLVELLDNLMGFLGGINQRDYPSVGSLQFAQQRLVTSRNKNQILRSRPRDT
ncbi:MAG: hypothetical protein DHS80DRAFT_25349 [Piptocephalis tieghemiana]|nr:MAG: hypothetical protein DHS80DRAFT_25349 [Piptocephalis tieghemiana]